MDLRTALLLPGQGAYRPGVFAATATAPVTGLLETVDAVLAEFGRPPITPLLTDPDAADARELSATDPFSLQLVIYASALGYAEAVSPQQPPDVLLGHSMGEIAAAARAGFLTAADGARIAAHRALALERVATAAGGMVSVNLSARRATALLTAAELPGLHLAVVNAPRHVVVSGPDAELGVLSALTDVMRAGAVRLNAPYPFHNPLLAAAQREFAAAITDIPQRQGIRRLYSPTLGDFVTDVTDVKSLLVGQLTRTVDFLAAVRELQTYGLESVVECGRAGLGNLIGATIPVTTETAERRLAAGPPGSAATRVSETAPLPAATVPATPVPEPEADSGADILRTLQQVYASRLGYPIEAMEPDADLEGDLGVDSLKRMEILGTLIDRFELQHVADDGRFVLQSTLADLAQLIAETSGGRKVVAGRGVDD